MQRRIPVLIAAFLAASLCPSRGRAQDNSATIEALFKQGKQLIALGKISEACPKFLASYNLEHRVGTLLNLADCYERNGQIASAWARFVEARTLAARTNQPERVEFATQHVAALEPRRSLFTIHVPHPEVGLVIKWDGIVVDAAALGIPVPIDGGAHTIEAAAPGKATRSDRVSIKAENDNQAYTLLPMADALEQGTQPLAGNPSGRMRVRGVVGLAVGGGGIIAAGLGAYFGVTSLSKNTDSSPYCGVGGVKDNCYGPGVSLRNSAVSDATISTVLVSTGAAMILGGALVWLTTPPSSSAVGVGFDGRSLHFSGAF